MFILERCLKNLRKSLPIINLQEFLDNATSQEEVFAIVHPNEILDDSFFTRISPYSVAGLFELGSIFTNFYTERVLLWLSNSKPDLIQMGIYNGPTFDLDAIVLSNDATALPERFNDDFSKYVHIIEDVINGKGNVESERNDVFTVFSITSDQLDRSKLYARYYSPLAKELREKLKSEAVVSLCEIAEITKPEVCTIGGKEYLPNCRSIHYDDLKYPFRIDQLMVGGVPTTCTVSKGDILYPLFEVGAKPYLFDSEVNEDIYVSPFITMGPVSRPRSKIFIMNSY